MEIRFYNKEMDFLGVMENQTSLLWRRRYNEPGEFELYAPITDDNLKLTEKTNLIWMRGCDEAGVIEDRKLEESDTKNEITAKGRFISSYMDRRLIKDTVNFTGKVEVAMRQLLSGAVPIPRVQLGELQGWSIFRPHTRICWTTRRSWQRAPDLDSASGQISTKRSYTLKFTKG